MRQKDKHMAQGGIEKTTLEKTQRISLSSTCLFYSWFGSDLAPSHSSVSCVVFPAGQARGAICTGGAVF